MYSYLLFLFTIIFNNVIILYSLYYINMLIMVDKFQGKIDGMQLTYVL